MRENGNRSERRKKEGMIHTIQLTCYDFSNFNKLAIVPNGYLL